MVIHQEVHHHPVVDRPLTTDVYVFGVNIPSWGIVRMPCINLYWSRSPCFIEGSLLGCDCA